MARKRYRLQCQLQSCGRAFWTTKPTQATCSPRCHALRRHAQAPGQLKAALQARWAHQAERPTYATVEEATAARRARERATGQRTHTIGDGWEQRGDREVFDEQGSGW